MDKLQIVTHNLPPVVRDPLVALLGQECYTTLVWNTDFTTPCIKLAVSKLLGVGIIAGGAIVKLPQIMKVLRSSSARGLSLSSYVLDTVATGITVAYNLRNGFPWSTYGEMVFLLVQNAILIVLIAVYSPRSALARLLPLTVLFSALAYSLSSNSLVPSALLSTLQTLTIPISLSSKLPQILTNHRLGSTGQLSAFLVFNSLAGCLARVFTTKTETNDPVLFWGFASAAALNAVIALQMLAYWNKHDVEVVQRRADGELSRVGVISVEKQDVPAVGLGQVPATSTPARKVSSPRTSSPASANARRYVRKLE
ncbi:SPOSA6832_04790, partial [Sporobolomyces salmonicolor]